MLKNISEGINMNKEIKESQLRNMIRGVIQEMFEEDLNEDNMGMPANAEEQEAMQSLAQNMEEDLQSTKGHFSDTIRDPETESHVDYETDAMEEGESPHEACAKKHPPGSLGHRMCMKKLQKKRPMEEDSGREEGEHYRRNREEDEAHLRDLEKDIDYDRRHEPLEESFFPKGRSTRDKARKELNESLMKRWGFTKKEK
jgi:hypothetical protein